MDNGFKPNEPEAAKPTERNNRLLTNNRPEEKEKKDHGPHLPEKDMEVRRPESPPLDPSRKQQNEEEVSKH